MQKTIENMKSKLIAEEAYDYLLKGTEGNSEKLNYYLEHWKYQNITSIPELCKEMLNQAKNKQGMPNYIGEVDNISDLIYFYDPNKIVSSFESWEDLFQVIVDSNYNPPGRINKDSSNNSWVQFCKSIFSISTYLTRFRDYKDFEKYVEQFLDPDKPDLRIGLPLILGEEIHGYGFTLACSFLKEYISPEFIKPDTHVKYISRKIGIAEEKDSDYTVYSKVVNFSKEANKKPYWIDKAFFLIGKGMFYDTEKYPNEAKIKCSKEGFVKIVQRKNLV